MCLPGIPYLASHLHYDVAQANVESTASTEHYSVARAFNCRGQ
ncbi:hypothetical protein TSMEX_007592 [Taenia solium]|eukprot:TsM_000301000 transcript=TsM_000301000 gene=TsM_000301000